MLSGIDYHFNYINTLRFFLLHQSGNFLNLHQIVDIKKIVLFFPIKNVDFLDHSFVFNYFYFFKFFFGYKAYFTGYESKFRLGLTTYSFRIQLVLKELDMFFFINIFMNDIIPVLNKGYLSWFLFSKKLNIYSFVIKDMSIFNEIKTNVGLFNLKHNLNFKLFFTGIDFKSSIFLINSLKIFLL